MIIFTFGVNDRGIATVRPDRNGQLNFHADGNCNAMGNVDLGGQTAMPVLFYGPNAEQPSIDIPEKPSLIFNQISEADSHGTALRRCSDFCRRFADVPVINHPDFIRDSSRDVVYGKLRDIPGVMMPRTIRCVPESPEHVAELVASEKLDLPVILRTVGDHNSQDMLRIDGYADLPKLHRFGFDGSEHFLIEFVDTADDRGLYTKYRILMVDGEPHARHVFFGPDWKVNSKSYEYMKAHPEMGNGVQMLDELDTHALPKARPALKEIAERLKLDFFSIDCHVGGDGELVVFEANATTFALSDKMPELSHRVMNIRAAVRRMMDRRSGLPGDATFSYSTSFRV
jgi:hypothetical protein